MGQTGVNASQPSAFAVLCREIDALGNGEEKPDRRHGLPRGCELDRTQLDAGDPIPPRPAVLGTLR
jgi:hypothetical protein